MPGRVRRFLSRPARPDARGILVALAAGVAMAAGQAPVGWWWLAFPALCILLRSIVAASGPAQAVWLGWLGGTGYFAAALFWIVEPFMVDPVRHGWMAPFALLFMAAGMALFWALAGGAGHVIGRDRAMRALGLALTFAAVELLRSYVLTGFPWALIGHIWIGTPVMQVAALAGPVGLTLLTTFAAALPVAFGGPGLAGGLAVLAMAWGWGHWRLSEPEPPREPPLRVRLVQPNVPQHEKWDPDRIPEHFDRLLRHTADPADPAPDLVIWPETAIPWLLDGAEVPLRMAAEAAGDAPVILGVQRFGGERAYNSLVVLDAAGRPVQLYDKHHLVPFGEYIPYGDWLSVLGLRGFAAREGDGYSPGPGPVVLDLGGGRGKVLPLICYEAVFPQDLRTTERADWILQITNDAWFGNLSGPYQHLAQARLRAGEQGLPLLRAANTGVSAVIDAKGRVVASLPLNTDGALDADVPGALPPTPYSRSGDWPVGAMLLVLTLGLIWARRRNRY